MQNRVFCITLTNVWTRIISFLILDVKYNGVRISFTAYLFPFKKEDYLDGVFYTKLS